MKNTSITLSDEYDAFIRKQIAAGRFGSASEAIRAGLRLLEEHELAVERLRAALDEGYMSGEPEPFDFDDFLASKKSK